MASEVHLCPYFHPLIKAAIVLDVKEQWEQSRDCVVRSRSQTWEKGINLHDLLKGSK